MPVPRDYDGDGDTRRARSIGRPRTSGSCKDQAGRVVRRRPGQAGACGVGDVNADGTRCRWYLGDFDGDGTADIAVHRPTTNQWFVRNQLAVAFGDPGDIPIPADYNFDRRMDIAVYRPTTGHWFVRNQPTVQFGTRATSPCPATTTATA